MADLFRDETKKIWKPQKIRQESAGKALGNGGGWGLRASGGWGGRVRGEGPTLQKQTIQ